MRGQATRSLPGRRLPAGPPPRWPARSQPHLARDGQQIPRSITMGAASRLLPGRRQPRPRPSAAGPPGNPGWIFFFFFPMQRPRLRLRDLVATRNRLQITTANLQGCCSLVGDTPKLWSCCSPAVPHFKLSSQAHPPCNPPNPARKSQSQERRPVPHKGSTTQPRPGASCGHLPSGWYPVLSSSPAKGSSTD